MYWLIQKGRSFMGTEFNSDILKIMQENNNSNADEINEAFNTLNYYMEKVYRFILAYHDYIYAKRDYGMNMGHTMIEIHILTDIVDKPGTNVTELALKWKRTTSTISGIIKALVDRELLIRIRNEQDGKVNDLYATELGQKLVLMHKKHDNKTITENILMLLKEVSLDDLNSFYKVCEVYADLVEKINP